MNEPRHIPAALESEMALVGALVRGVHGALVREALPRPDACYRRDHAVIAKAA